MAARAFLLVLTVTLSSCGAEAVIGPLIVLTNTWRNEAVQNHTFQINDDTQGSPRRSGHFTGRERTPQSEEFDFTGFWNTDGHVEFTVQRPGGNVRYSGTLTSNLNRMELTSSAGNLVLVRP